MWEDKIVLTEARKKMLEGFEPAYKEDKIFLPDIEAYMERFPSLAFFRHGEALAFGGVVPLWEGSATFWNIVSRQGREEKISLFKGIKKGLQALEEEGSRRWGKIKRGRTIAVLSRPEAIKLNKLLGFEPEAVFRKYDRLENDCLIMIKIFD